MNQRGGVSAAPAEGTASGEPLIAGSTATAAGASSALRSGGRFTEPRPAPALPEVFDPFDPPAPGAGPGGAGEIDEEAMAISGWTRAAGPDEHLVVMGHGFDRDDPPTRFAVFGQDAEGRFEGEARVVHRRAHQAMLRLPVEAPAGSLYLLTPIAGDTAGPPVAVNRAEVWYTLPRKAAPGETCAVFGRNLSHEQGEAAGWVYLKPAGEESLGVWAEVTAANPYRLEFVLPDDLRHGKYEVWAHNGHGGRYGWAALHHGDGGSISAAHLTVAEPRRWDGPTFDVTEFGADGDDDADDTDAVLEALGKANQSPRSTVYFPAGTYYVSRTIGPVKGKDDAGLRIRGQGMDKTFIKGAPGKAPKLMMRISGGNVELRDLVLDINELGESRKYYRGADRGEHNPDHYAWLEKVDAARDAIKKWRKKHKGEPVPDAMQPPPSPGFADVEERRRRVAPASKRGGGRFLVKDVWASGLTIVNCVLDAERRDIELLKGVSNALIENCDIVAREVQLGCPQYTRVRRCNFYARADTGVILYMYGGWCNSFTHNTARDYMPNTYDTGMGRWYTVTAYGNRQENVYIAHNRTHDLTVNPRHYNQNSGEQVMWEDMPITSTQRPSAVDGRTLVFPEPVKGKLKWHSDAIIVSGKGAGQYRRVEDYDAKTRTLTVAADWRVPPNTDSVVQVGRPIRRIVVYRNHLDAKPRAAASESHIASAGVEPFGASVDLIVDRNTFHQLRAGIATFSPYLWHRYTRNTFDANRVGVRLGEGTAAVVRRNAMTNLVDTGYQTTSGEKWPEWKLEAFEHNRGDSVPRVARLGSRYNKDVDAARIIVYRNRFSRGEGGPGGADAAGPAVHAREIDDLILEGNEWRGYDRDVAAE